MDKHSIAFQLEDSMSEAKQQTLKNHTRFDPMFHFFLVPVLAVTIFVCIIHLVHLPSHLHAVLLVLAVCLFLAVGRMRAYSLKVQDRIIRLEERLRLAALLAEPLRSRIHELSERQLIALRFASDAEIPALVDLTLRDNLTAKQIKQAIQVWRPDYWRV